MPATSEAAKVQARGPTQEPDDRPCDIYIVGLGISSVRHVTREVEAVIRRSEEVLYVAAGYGIDEYLESLCKRVTNLHPVSYRHDRDRLYSYDFMSSSVVSAALDHPPVTFALYGHPLIYVFPSHQIIHAAEYLGLRVQVLPGISALDTIFIDLKLDPSVQGLQMYEATELMIRKRPLQPDVPCLLWQIGAVETNLYSESISKPQRFTRIKNYLLQFYPENHPVTTVYSSSHPLIPSTLNSFPLGEIETQHQLIHQALTLYIPPVRIRPVADEELVRKLDSVEHLNRLVTPLRKQE